MYMFEFMKSRENKGEKYYTAGKDLELLRNIEDKKEIGHMCHCVINVIDDWLVCI